MTELKRIDPRGPRFGAAITAIISLLAFNFFLSSSWTYTWILLWVLLILFSWSVFIPGGSHPYSIIFQKLVRPRLRAPKELEDPRPPHFAQQVGLTLSLFGTIAGFFWIEGTAVAAALIFIASFLNSVFGLCLGCQMYIGLKRLGVIRK